MSPHLDVDKPEPITLGAEARSFTRGVDVASTIDALKQGEYVVVKDVFGSGVSLLKELHADLKSWMPHESLPEQRAYRAEYFKLSNRILLEVADHSLVVKKAPTIGWFQELYSDHNNFHLSFPQVQGLNSAWQWYERGISIPGLRAKLHPYYGVYFPTRFEHIELFEKWLKDYRGPKQTAIDVGIGCGVLSLQMIQKGWQKVYATDSNPNAIVGMAKFVGTTKLARKIKLDHGHLFGRWDRPAELIVFNPPWLPETHESDGIDRAIYYSDRLFPEFFAEAKKRLLPEGNLVLLFSNLAQITGVTTDHPIGRELAEGGRFKLEQCLKKSVGAGSRKTKRNQPWRDREEVELWVLTHR
ncbi:methyltransferase [Opitutaceae bacterium]|nr:methyltransferase [Opitutaceae bacterium]MDB4474827.1 methyltransferase [Opitutaceae bacterium]